jgi:hypothetical protein
MLCSGVEGLYTLIVTAGRSCFVLVLGRRVGGKTERELIDVDVSHYLLRKFPLYFVTLVMVSATA